MSDREQSAMSHEEVNELLPWYVNGTLEGLEHARVEGHLGTCLKCRRALNEERRLKVLIEKSSHSNVAAADGFEHLISRIDARSQERDSGHALREWRMTRWSIAATLLLAVGAGSWFALTPLERPPPSEFMTASDPSEASALSLDVVFNENLTAADREALLREIGARVVEGPSAIGRYRLQLEDSTADIDAVLMRLGDDARVRFAARVYATE